MTNVARSIEQAAPDTPRGASGRLADLRARIVRAARAADLEAAGGPRYRAVQRRRTRTASRVGFLVMAAAVGIDAGALIGLGSPGAWAAIAMDMVVMAGALIGWWLLPRGLVHYPELAAWVITMGVVVSTVVSGLAAPDLTVQSIAYLLVLPGLIALVLPWRTTVHLRWLLAFTVVAMGFLVVDPASRFSGDERGDLAIVLLIAVGASLAGHVLLQATSLRAFTRLAHIHALRRKATADMAELSRVHRELEVTARIDPLTGAGNRRRLDEDLRAVRGHLDRSGVRYGLLELDLDHFKGINDRLGHLAGDDVLRRVVAGIQSELRATDSIYRYGGEEFIVILPVVDEASLVEVAERLRALVFDLGIEHPSNEHGVVSVSIGAMLLDAPDVSLPVEQWFRLTDRAMYEAKARGRNQVCWVARAA